MTLHNDLVQSWEYFRQGFGPGSLHSHPIQTVITVILMLGLLGSFVGLCAGISQYIGLKLRRRSARAYITQSDWLRTKLRVTEALDRLAAAKWSADEMAFQREAFDKLHEDHQRMFDMVQSAVNRIGLQDAQIAQLNERLGQKTEISSVLAQIAQLDERLGQEAETVSVLSEVLTDALAKLEPKKKSKSPRK